MTPLSVLTSRKSSVFHFISCPHWDLGTNDQGQLGQGNTDQLGDNSGEMGDNIDAIQLGDDFIPLKLVAGVDFNCVLSISNTIKCWGTNWRYQLGGPPRGGDTLQVGDYPNEMGNNLTAVDLGTDFIPIDIAAGAYHACAMTEAKAVKCWGQYILSLSACCHHCVSYLM